VISILLSLTFAVAVEKEMTKICGIIHNTEMRSLINSMIYSLRTNYSQKTNRFIDNITELNDNEIDNILSDYLDGNQVNGWARKGVAICIEVGIVSGKGEGILDLRANITRAEVATIIERLLIKSNLI
jgi:hypothetical protein